MFISTALVEIDYVEDRDVVAQEESMRLSLYDQRVTFPRSAASRRLAFFGQAALVVLAFAFLAAVTFGLLG
jgi:hypothetical protein